MSNGGAPPYPRYYAVNDRPVALVPTMRGGLDCVAFDFATGAMVPERSYFTRLTPGAGGDVDALREDEFARIVGELRAGLVVRWARTLCHAEPGDADVLAALGLAGRDDLLGAALVSPRARGGVEFHLVGDGMTLDMLTARVGSGVERHSGVDPLEWRGFAFEEEGAPFRSHLLAGFVEPDNARPVRILALWREPASSRER